jgi:hypothetical protein
MTEGPLDESQGSRCTIALLCALGVAVRLLFLLLAGPLELQSDEASYVYLALSLDHFGHHQDAFRFLWPPGFTFLIAKGLAVFGHGGLTAVKLAQVVASASIGATIMLFARRLFGMRAARIAGVIWIAYLPLLAYTHYLWPEPFFLAAFLPALYLVLDVLERPRDGGAVDGRLGLAGLLFAAAVYIKEAPFYLLPVLAVLLFLFAPGAREGVRRATLLLLATTVGLAPWTLRNFEVYGRFVPVASTLGENLHAGVNPKYKNHDIQIFGKGPHREARLPEGVGREWFTAPPEGPGWDRAHRIHNTPDRLNESTRRGIEYGLAHPEWLLRSRIKKLADLFAPLSFFVRHVALGRYDDSALRWLSLRALIVWAVACPLLVLPLGFAGLFAALRDRAARWLFGAVLAYFVCTGLLVSMSRFRIPMMPLLIVLAGGLLAEGVPAPARNRATASKVAAVVAVLAFLWWVDLPEVLALLRLAWVGPA